MPSAGSDCLRNEFCVMIFINGYFSYAAIESRMEGKWLSTGKAAVCEKFILKWHSIKLNRASAQFLPEPGGMAPTDCDLRTQPAQREQKAAAEGRFQAFY